MDRLSDSVPVALKPLIDPVFPFYMVVDDAFKVRGVGHSLAHVCGLSAGDDFHASFALIDPLFDTADAAPEWNRLLAMTNVRVVLRHHQSGLRLRGQFVVGPLQGGLVFLGSPWLEEPDDLERFGLRSADFALHDSTLDLLAAMQSTRTSIDDANQALKSLRTQSSQLHQVNAALQASARALDERNALLQDLGKIQLQYIAEPDSRACFEAMLATLIRFTDSEYGFVGEVLEDEQGAPYLRTHAITNIAWTDEYRALYASRLDSGLEFRNLDTLFGRVMTDRQVVIANDPGHDPRRGGLPPGHPAMHAFLGLPVFNADSLIGMVGVANRPGGYDAALVEATQPLLATYASLIEARRSRQERERARRTIQSQDSMIKQKENLIQEVHHRVKNNLQIVSSLLSLQKMDGITAEAAGQLDVAHARIASIATLHELLYRSADLESVRLGQLVRELVGTFSRIHGDIVHRVRFVFDLSDEIRVTEDQAGPLTLTLNELLTNATKHAFPGDRFGSITVSARVTMTGPPEQPLELRLLVADDGIGLPQGFDLARATGLGARIVSRLVRQLDGQIELEPGPVGTRWALRLPLSTG